MKKRLLFVIFTLFSITAFAQSNADDLIKKGIQLYDNGDYGEAVRMYKQALAIDNNSPLANYELSLTYMSLKDYENALRYSRRSIELDGKSLPPYIIQGSALDDLGRSEEAIEIFEKAVKRFGDHHLLYYNQGLTYYRLNNVKKAEIALMKAIETNPSHASSHLLLAQLMSESNRKIQSLLGLHYFLLLEANTSRSKDAYQLLMAQLSGNLNVDEQDNKHISIAVHADSEFSGAEMMLSMLEVSKTLPEKEGEILRTKSEIEQFINQNASLFKILGELKKKKDKGVYWEIYVSLFYRIAKSRHTDTYSYYISQSANEEATKWLQQNQEKLEQFRQWLGKN